MKKKILITGASGFIGAAVCKKLSKKYQVIGIVSPFSKTVRLKKVSNKMKIISVDLAQGHGVYKIFKKYNPDYVIHLATHGVYSYQQNDEDRIIIDNYLMLANLLKYSVKFDVKKFINTGSVFEYGTTKGKVKESDIDLSDILNKYSGVKIATTALVNSYAQNINVMTLRLFTTYGPGEDDTRFVKSTIDKAMRREPIRLVKGVVRDFVYIDDVADAYAAAIEIDYKSGEIINIAGGSRITLTQFANLVKKITNSNSTIICDQTFKRFKESACWADISRAKKVLGWSPKNSVLIGIKKMLYFLKDDK